jgi:hypothetical protein
VAEEVWAEPHNITCQSSRPVLLSEFMPFKRSGTVPTLTSYYFPKRSLDPTRDPKFSFAVAIGSDDEIISNLLPDGIMRDFPAAMIVASLLLDIDFGPQQPKPLKIPR